MCLRFFFFSFCLGYPVCGTQLLIMSHNPLYFCKMAAFSLNFNNLNLHFYQAKGLSILLFPKNKTPQIIVSFVSIVIQYLIYIHYNIIFFLLLCV